MGKIRTQKGIASFYTVAIATLLLGVLAVGFTTVVVNEINRTTNFDLSKSAYDSALAGVEDAKVAIMNYKSCIEQGAVAEAPSGSGTVTCNEIVWYMEHPDCYMVGHILGRIPKDVNTEVRIQETRASNSSSGQNNMEQAYTCVTITNPTDYRTRLNSSNSTRVIPIKLKNTDVSEINTIRVSWADNSGINYNISNFLPLSREVVFPSRTAQSPSNPPTLGIQLIQTAPEFSLRDFDYSQGQTTDRGFVFLVPSNGPTGNANNTKTKSYIDVTSTNIIPANLGFVKSNDKTSSNLPFLVNCNENTDSAFLCSVSINLPKPVSPSGARSSETFALVVSLPYSAPDTDVAISLCKSATSCEAYSTDENLSTGSETNATELINQTRIDSTGRANNLFRRIESRVDTSSNLYFNFAYSAIEALGDENEVTIRKDLVVDSEDTFLTAPAQVCINRYTLSFSANGAGDASGIPGQMQECDSDSAIFVLPDTTPYRPNYDFAGWARTQTADSSTVLYRPGSNFSVNQPNTTLYAIWKAKTVFIDYHDNTGRIFYQRQMVTYGNSAKYFKLESFQIPRPTPPAIGYDLIGWTTVPGSKNVVYNIDATFTANTNLTLYAVWRKEVKLSFYQMNNTLSEITIYFYNNENTATFNAPVVQRASNMDISWNIIGWSRSNTSDNMAFSSGQSSITATANMAKTYYATMVHAEKVTYIVEGNAWVAPDPESNSNKVLAISKGPNGGYNTMPKGVPLPSAPAVTQGYQFEKWCLGSLQGTQYSAGTTFNTSTQAVTFYARVVPGSFTITFKSYDGAKTYGTQIFTYLTAQNLRSYDATSGWTIKPTSTSPSGKSFYGWTTTPNSTTRQYTNSQSLSTVKQNIVLYAIWYKTYTVSFVQYDINPETRTTTVYNATTAGTINAPAIRARSGYTPAAWSTSNSSNNSALSSGQTNVSVSENKTYYAAYTFNVSLIYNSNGGTGTQMPNSTKTSTSIVKAKGSSHEAAVNIPITPHTYTRDGYSFTGWNLGSTSGTLYQDNATVNTNRNMTLYARWAQILTISYYNHDGGVLYNRQTFNQGDSVTLNGSFNRPGYTFVGWSTSKNATTPQAQNGQTISNINANRAYYAISKKTLSVRFLGPSTNVTKTGDLYNGATLVTITSPAVPGLSGYTSVGWSTSPTSVAGQLAGNTNFNIGTNNTYYAYYNYNITVSYNANGGTGSVSSQTATAQLIHDGTNARQIATSVTLAANGFSRTNYIYNKWAVGSPDGTTYNPGAVIYPSANTVVYALWTEIPYVCGEGETKIVDNTYGASSGGYICVRGTNGVTYVSNTLYPQCEYDEQEICNYTNTNVTCHTMTPSRDNGRQIMQARTITYGICDGNSSCVDVYYNGYTRYSVVEKCNSSYGCGERSCHTSWAADPVFGSQSYYYPYTDYLSYGAEVTYTYEYECKKMYSYHAYGTTYNDWSYGHTLSEYEKPACTSPYSNYPNSTADNTKCYRNATKNSQ